MEDVGGVLNVGGEVVLEVGCCLGVGGEGVVIVHVVIIIFDVVVGIGVGIASVMGVARSGGNAGDGAVSI